jgi:hypothetical protein
MPYLHCFQFCCKKCHEEGQANQEGLKLTGMNQLLMNAGDVNKVSGIIYINKKNTEALLVTSNEVGLEVNAEKTKNVIMS